MTIRLEMLAASRASLALLGEEGRQIVGRYFQQHQNTDGGFADPAGRSDLYYTVFAVEGLSALNMPFDTAALRNYLTTFGCGESLDFVHLCCLVRAWASRQRNCESRIDFSEHGRTASCELNDNDNNTNSNDQAVKEPRPEGSGHADRQTSEPQKLIPTINCEFQISNFKLNDNDKNRNNKNNNTGETPVRRMGKMPMPRTTATPYQSPADEILRKQLLAQIERHRCDDGGFSQFGHAATGTAYGCFLAMGAYQELAGTDTAAGQMDGVPRSGGPCPPYLLRCLQSLRTTDGAYANEPGQAVGMTSATAAASIVLRQLNQPSPPGVADWLLARREQDGFLASPAALMPDLLSTATGLHALAGMGIPTATMAEPVSAFVTSLLCEDGGFRGNWLEHNSDCEYTFYALLALGSVSSAGITDIKK